MILFGFRASIVQTRSITAPCTACGHSSQVAMVLQKYFHIFWIPTLPAGKRRLARCTHCKMAAFDRQFSPAQKQAFANLQTVTPKWTFAGLFILAILLGWQNWNSLWVF